MQRRRVPEVDGPAWRWLAAGGVGFVLLGLAGLAVYRAELRQVEAMVERDLATIAKLKAEQVTGWRRDRLREASEVSERAAVAQRAELWPAARRYGFRGMQEVDGAGRVVWSPAGGHEVSEEIRSAVQAARRKDRPVMVGIGESLAAVTPLAGRGALVLELGANAGLAELLSEWPHETRTGRARLVRAGGRGARNGGVFEAAAEVRDSDWVVVTQVERSEGLTTRRHALSIMLGWLLSLMAALALAMAAGWQRERQRALHRMHEADERLLAEERRYHLWLDQLPAGVWLRDAGGRLAFANRAAGDMVGIAAEGLIGRESRLGDDWWFCDEEGREMDVERDLLEVVARTGRERRAVVVGIRAPAAEETRWLLVNSQPWEGGVLSTSIDITDRKRAEEALQVSKEQLQQALEVGEIGVFDHDYETGKVFWSGRLQTLFQTGEGDVLGMELTLERMHPEDRRWVEAEIRKAQEPGENGRIELEHRLLRPDGTVRWVRARARFSFEGEGQARRLTRAVGACVDVTSAHVAMEERERFREGLARAQRLEAVGRLAGGVAHEFNNLLTVILGYTERLGRWLPAGAEQQVWTGEIGKAGRRAAKLAAQLLAFGRRQMLRRTWVDVNLVVLEAVRILDEMAGGMVRWEAQLDPRLEQIRADHDQLFEIVMSLGMNAREAVDGQGRVELGTAMSEVDAKDAEGHAERRAGRYVVLTVRDHGRGMGAEELEQIFEPFYTTKAAGSGTGMSLPSAYGAARQNGGWLEVESEPGRGSTFRVYLPAREEEGGGRA